MAPKYRELKSRGGDRMIAKGIRSKVKGPRAALPCALVKSCLVSAASATMLVVILLGSILIEGGRRLLPG